MRRFNVDSLFLFQLETQLEYAKFQKDVWATATTFKWKTFRDPSIRRQFKVLSVLGRAALPEDKLKEVDPFVYLYIL